MKKKSYIIIKILLLIFLCGCGKKQKNIFNFANKKEKQKVNKFNLGFIKGIQAKKLNEGNFITWRKLEIPEIYKSFFLGYNVYRLNKSLLIPKKPLNIKPISKTSFLDKEILFLSVEKIQDRYHYVVYPVFFIDKLIHGAASQVICTSS